MAYVAYITTAGQAAIADAEFNGYKIALTRYLIGNTLITETSAAAIRNYTQLPGTVVYDSGNNPTDESLTYTKLSSGAITISVYLHSNIGDFTIGSIALCLEDGTLFAILKLTETYSKIKNTGNVAGNVISFPFTFTLTIQSVLSLNLTPETVSSLPLVATENDLPLYNVAPYNNYYIQNFAGTGLAAISCKASSTWQYVIAANNDVFENWIKVPTGSFESTVLEGNIAYYNITTSKWTNLDGDGLEQKLIGVRQGNGIRIGAIYYKQNFFQQGQHYYVDTYPQAGRLTTRESKYYVGTALTNSLLKLDLSYVDTTYEGKEYTYYHAALASGNVIKLTLDDEGKYPDAYTNGLRISFVTPINMVAGQKIQIGTDLQAIKLTKRIYSNTISYSSSLSANDIKAGSLVEAIFLAVDEGFRCNQSILSATDTSEGLQTLRSNRNAIINGDFNIWQRGTSFTSVGAGIYTSDRWQYGKNGAMVHDITLSSDVPTVAQAGRLIRYSLKIDCQTVDASIASSEYAMLSQNIEGYNFIPLAQKTMTLSFWVKATKTGIYSVSFRNGGPDRSYVAEYTVNVSNTWEFKTLTILPSPASGSWDYTNSRGLSVDFTLAVGSTFQTTKDAWQTGNFLGTSNQVNACDSTSNDFFIAGVQLEAGSVATPFEYRTVQQELFLCQRYFEFGYVYAVSYASSGSYVQRCIFPYKNNKRTGAPSGSVSVISGPLTSPSISAISEYNAWIGYASVSAGLEGVFAVAISSEL